MLKRITLHISGLIAFFIAVSFLAGELVTGSAATATETLSTDLPVHTVKIPTSNGTNVHGWLVHGKSDKGAVLLVHSIRSNRVEMLSRARFLNENGYHVLLIDLQAHGETPGKRITFGARESENVKASVKFLRETFPNERIGREH